MIDRASHAKSIKQIAEDMAIKLKRIDCDSVAIIEAGLAAAFADQTQEIANLKEQLDAERRRPSDAYIQACLIADRAEAVKQKDAAESSFAALRRQIAGRRCTCPSPTMANEPHEASCPKAVEGCIGCGATMLVGYTIERQPGPFCRDCWEALKLHVAQVNLLNAKADADEFLAAGGDPPSQ